MTPELTALALAALLQALQFALFAIPANIELGTGYTSSARDRPPSRQISERTGRLQRAMNNHFEGLVLFTIAVVVVTLGGQSTGFTAYAYGWRPWRSAIWGVGFFATLAMIVAALI